MKKLTLEDIKNTAWDLSKQTEEERGKWLLAGSKLGTAWRYGSKVSCTSYKHFYIDDCGRLTYGSQSPFTAKARKVMQYTDLVQDEVKLRVDFFLSVGGKFAVGDAATDQYSNEVIVASNTAGDWNRPCDSDNKRTIKSFTVRGGHAPLDVPLVAKGSRLWKYDIDKLIEEQIYTDAIKAHYQPEPEQEAPAPVYTQEMHDNGIRPVAGMQCLFAGAFARIDFYGKEVAILSSKIVTEVRVEVSSVNPVDTRTDDEKAIDELAEVFDAVFSNDDFGLSGKQMAAMIIKAGYKKQ